MTSLHRGVRKKAPPIVVRVRRIKHRAPSAIDPRPRRAAAPQDLPGLIFYGQG